MTEQGKCETCRHWNGPSGRESWRDVCHQLRLVGLDLYAKGDYGEKVTVPPDWGCIYHEPKPEKHCESCRHWRGTWGNLATEWRRCVMRSAVGRLTYLTHEKYYCEQWEEKHG